MKKFFVAMLALCAMAVSFTSCEQQADPTKEPIAGKTYQVTDSLGNYINVAFRMNHQTILTVKSGYDVIVQNSLEWKMDANAKDFRIIWAQGTYNTQTGEPVGGQTLYNGVYNKDAKQVSLATVDPEHPAQYVLDEVQ